MTASSRRVAVVGGHGKSGRAVSQALLAAGHEVRTLGRAEWSDLTEALAGVDVLHVIAPNLHPDEAAYVETALGAARAAGIRRVGYHSVASPYAPAMPHHLGKARAEDVVRRSGLDWTILQPCAYVQNLLPGLAGDPPAVRVPYDVDRPHALVDLADVAECTAEALLDEGHVGATYELGGPPVTLREAAAAAAGVLGRDVQVERVDRDAWERGPGARLTEGERAGLRAMFEYYDAHGFPAGWRVTGLLLGRPPRSVADVVRRELGQPARQSTGDRAE